MSFQEKRGGDRGGEKRGEERIRRKWIVRFVKY